MTEAETILGNIIGISSEGQGIIRYNGFVIFIPFTVTGDVIRYRIARQKKNFALGELVEVVEPSPLRSVPQCPYFGTCGGCQVQYLRYEAQLASKRQWIEDSLKKIGGFDTIHVPPVVPAQQQWGYRRRINLILQPHGKTYQAGYIATDQHTHLPVNQCPIFANANDPIVSIVQKMANELRHAGPEEGRASVLKAGHHDYMIHFHFRKMPENIEQICSDVFSKGGSVVGILASSPRKTFRWGMLENSFYIDSLQFNYSPKAFIQSNPEQSLNIYKVIAELGKKYRPSRVLDLYCGIGVTSCLLGHQGIAVTGIEANPEAVRLANENAKKNQVDTVRFVVSDVEAVLEGMLKQECRELIIVNPPREGLTPSIVQALSDHPAETLIYISCKPSTLARDLKQLCKHAYTMETTTAYDMFPQTVHVETLVVLRKSTCTP